MLYVSNVFIFWQTLHIIFEYLYLFSDMILSLEQPLSCMCLMSSSPILLFKITNKQIIRLETGRPLVVRGQNNNNHNTLRIFPLEGFLLCHFVSSSKGHGINSRQFTS